MNFQYNAGLLNVLKDYGIVSPLSYLPNFYELKCFYLDDFGNLIKKEKSKRYEIKAASYRPYCVHITVHFLSGRPSFKLGYEA